MTSKNNLEQMPMKVTCHVKYIIDPDMLSEFEHYAKLWIPLVEKFGGQHHGYFLPGEGANDVAIALFSFPSLADYEVYRHESAQDVDCLSAFYYAKKHKFILRYERSFMRPVLE
ncbi:MULTISPECIES: NIPSNAP family protein [Shewanella]|uniref:NIPSNAP family protein n=1 Tax=Shewanella nanhaiensis TaxID=2864872 RepID=A0ABS7DY40_9GAMM|nr:MULTISPECIES: NIPSNAP family protein [Shewanella]MBW8182340.1 NIPSNAP family protein [Shewanella nanhaiensis]